MGLYETGVLAYTAGIIDGEGTVGLVRNEATSNRRPCLTVPSTTKEMLLWLKQQHGGCISRKRKAKEHHSESWVWSLSGDKAINLLRKVAAYMLEPVKTRRVQLLVDEYKAVTKRNGKYTPEELRLKKEFENKFFDYTRMT